MFIVQRSHPIQSHQWWAFTQLGVLSSAIQENCNFIFSYCTFGMCISSQGFEVWSGEGGPKVVVAVGRWVQRVEVVRQGLMFHVWCLLFDVQYSMSMFDVCLRFSTYFVFRVLAWPTHHLRADKMWQLETKGWSGWYLTSIQYNTSALREQNCEFWAKWWKCSSSRLQFLVAPIVIANKKDG